MLAICRILHYGSSSCIWLCRFCAMLTICRTLHYGSCGAVDSDGYYSAVMTYGLTHSGTRSCFQTAWWRRWERCKYYTILCTENTRQLLYKSLPSCATMKQCLTCSSTSTLTLTTTFPHPSSTLTLLPPTSPSLHSHPHPSSLPLPPLYPQERHASGYRFQPYTVHKILTSVWRHSKT